MKNRFGLLIAAAVSMACFSLPSVADIESVTPAGFYQIEVTPQALGEMDAIAVVETAIEIQTEQSLEAMAIGPGSNNSPAMFARTDSGGLADDWEGFLKPNNDGNEFTGWHKPFEVGWKTVNS